MAGGSGGHTGELASNVSYSATQRQVLQQAADILGVPLLNLLAAVQVFQSGLNFANSGLLGTVPSPYSHIQQLSTRRPSQPVAIPRQDHSHSQQSSRPGSTLGNHNFNVYDTSLNADDNTKKVGQGTKPIDYLPFSSPQDGDHDDNWAEPDWLDSLTTQTSVPEQCRESYTNFDDFRDLQGDITSYTDLLGDNSVETQQPLPVPQISATPVRRNKKRKRNDASESDEAAASTKQRGRRKAFRNEAVREATACTRKAGACIRCRMQRIRCVQNDEDPSGACLTCLDVTGPTLCKLPCLRYKIVDARLLDHADAPRPAWTTRWSKMELVDIQNWASPEQKTITITQDVAGSSINLKVREFVPQKGDVLARFWVTSGVRCTYDCAPYAIEKMDETAADYIDFVDKNLENAIWFYTGDGDPLVRDTYRMAYRYFSFAERKDEKELLHDALRLWMGSRMETRSDRICSEETLGMQPHEGDSDCPNSGLILVPPVMNAQIEIIMVTKILQPKAKAVLHGVQELVYANRARSWFTVYLVMFILLHSCALLTAADNKKARKQGLQDRFFRHALVEELHVGAKTLLAYFHYCNKGSHPFTLDWAQKNNVKRAELNSEQVDFVRETARQVEKKGPLFQKIRDERDFEHELYFLSQLYTVDWMPEHTI